ncbi:hypothetical protein D3C80_1759890 [compost metagenome]
MVLCRITAMMTTKPTEAMCEAEPATTALIIARIHAMEKAGRYGSTAFTTRGNRW